MGVALAVAVFLLAVPARTDGAPPAGSPIRLPDAAEQGAFNVGAARAVAGRATDPTAGDVLKLDYTTPPGTAAGVWAKSFPEGLDADTIDVVSLGARAETPDQARAATGAVEIKGSAGVQRIPFALSPDWTYREVPVDWPAVGRVKEVVVSITPEGGPGPATGTVYLDVRFERLPLLRRLSTHPAGRAGGVLLVAGLAAALVGLARALGKGLSGEETFHLTPPAADIARPTGPGRDFVQGVGIVLIAGVVAGVYYLGGYGRLDIGWTALGVALAGAAVAEWLKWGLAGRHLTAGEAFRDVLATGLPAATVGPLALLQAPASWAEVYELSQAAAAAVVLAYHAANFCRLSAACRHLGPASGLLVLATPYVFGCLLLLRPDCQLLADWPDAGRFAGRVAVVFAFNVAVVNGLSAATGRTLLRSGTAYLTLLAVAVVVVAAPWVAAFGSGAKLDPSSVVGRIIDSLTQGRSTGWKWVVFESGVSRMIAAVAAAAVSQAGLWAEVYLITGLALDALRGTPPSAGCVRRYAVEGAKKGAVFSGTFMAFVYVPGLLWELPAVRALVADYPVLLGGVVGALVFPLLKTVVETFDGSRRFFGRSVASYGKAVLYARGAVVGLGVGYAVSVGMHTAEMGIRVGFGFGVGAAAFAGVSLLRDALTSALGRGRAQPARAYLVQALLGGFVGAAIGFYLDAAQVALVGTNFRRYLAAGATPEPFGVYPFVSKWGFINLGDTTGGASLLFAQALAGVIEWSIPAWLFAINRKVLEAYFRRDTWPVRALVTREGLADLTENMIAVFRWGLWMSPIIKSFLRPMGTPTWYNQDGAVRTVLAIFEDATTDVEGFRAWSLRMFIALLAYDGVRIAIWVDHMGLRVATLVNLSFIGMDRLDARLARFLAPAATARCIPEAVKRFTTWAPLLIPFYLPKGADWDTAWTQSQAIQKTEGPGLVAEFFALPPPGMVLVVAGAVVACTAAFAGVRIIGRRFGPPARADRVLANGVYEVTASPAGAVVGHVPARGYDVTRRSYDLRDPAGRALFLVDPADTGPRAWPVVGNYPAELAAPSRLGSGDEALTIWNGSHGLPVSVEITLPGPGDPAELWAVTIENPADAPRTVGVVPYLEWVLNRPGADRGHTQYNRLFAEVEYVSGLHAVLAWDKHAKAAGFLASDAAPDGFLSVRVDFIGRAGTVWEPRALETLAFKKAEDTAPHPTFDPIGSLLVWVTVPPRGTAQARFLIGLTADKNEAADLITKYLGIPNENGNSELRIPHSVIARVGHGEVPPDTPRPYFEFSADGRRLLIRTPFTPRPWDHTMSNALGHAVTVTDRGLHTSCSVNAQQNRLTPDWPDTVTREVPGEAIYLYDPDRREWYSPVYHPLNDRSATQEVEYGVDGTATFHSARGEIETELTVFVPPDDPTGVYLLTVRNRGDAPRRMRVAPYFQMVLAEQPESAGPLAVRHDAALNALCFENPRNRYRTGPAFAAFFPAAELVETRRGGFFGAGRGVAHPVFVEQAGMDIPAADADPRPIAAFLVTLDLPPRGEASAVVVLGQADDWERAEAVVRKYQSLDAARAALEATRRWWLALMDTVKVHTRDPAFDRYLDWLKYQAVAERLWARRGFYQASGAFGFRDQLQDAVNLLWADPAFARRQIVLHAAQQFREGDVAHWFHLLQDGRTGLVGRTYASDPLLWLPWAVVDYLAATGDDSVLDETTRYLEAEQPLAPLPAGKGGMGFDPLRSARADTVYRHCLRAIDLVLDHRMGRHGLPLMLCGDWNDGLDEIGSEGKGESVWLGFFLLYVLDRMTGVVGRREDPAREEYYRGRAKQLRDALEWSWRGDRYLRAVHDDGTEIGVGGSGVWEIDALTAAWAVTCEIDPERARVGFDTAVRILEQDTTILLGWPPLREDTKPYLGRSSWYPEGVRENGMYCHGVQWLVGAARVLADRFEREANLADAHKYRETAYRLWLKVSPLPHTTPDEVETYGGQPNKQAADMVTTFDPGRMIWNGYTGAAGWMFRQALEGVLGLRLADGAVVPAAGPPVDELGPAEVARDLAGRPNTGG